MSLSIITLISGILWGQPVWGSLIILDKKILDIIFIICIYATYTYNNNNNIKYILIFTLIYLFIKSSLPDDVSSLHQNVNNKSNFLNSVPLSYKEMIINNVTIVLCLLVLYLLK